MRREHVIGALNVALRRARIDLEKATQDTKRRKGELLAAEEGRKRLEEEVSSLEEALAEEAERGSL